MLAIACECECEIVTAKEMQKVKFMMKPEMKITNFSKDTPEYLDPFLIRQYLKKLWIPSESDMPLCKCRLTSNYNLSLLKSKCWLQYMDVK